MYYQRFYAILSRFKTSISIIHAILLKDIAPRCGKVRRVDAKF